MTHHAIQMADGTVAIMQTVPQLVGLDKDKQPVWRDPTPEECLAKWHPSEQAKVVSHKPIDPAVIPQSRELRNAWVLNGDKIEHDPVKVEAIKTERAIVAKIAEDDARALADRKAAAAIAVAAEKHQK